MTADLPPSPQGALSDISHRYFFDGGLRFGCRNCGDCCTGDEGQVRVTAAEQAAMAAFLQVPLRALRRHSLCRLADGGRGIRELGDGRCLFYHDGCRIYPVRPLQCRTWPFWMENLRSGGNWNRVARRCPGIGRGQRYGREEILEIAGRTF